MTTSRLTPRSRGLRQVGGLAEDRIWARLRGGAVNGWKVRRQHPVGGYVVDFACVPLRWSSRSTAGCMSATRSF